MPLEISWRPEVGQKIEKFFNDPGYKDYLENAVAFNRKLNEERKMRLPYIDCQTGVAQRHYNSTRNSRERMPPPDDAVSQGKIICYPQKHWHKNRYQYLRYFMQPKHRAFDPEADMHTISQVENPTVALNSGPVPGAAILNPSASSTNSSMGMNEDSNHSSGGGKEDIGGGWTYYEDEYNDGSMMEDDFNSDSDYEFEDTTYGSRKKKGETPSRSGRGKKSRGVPKGSGSGVKRRTHADSIPDSEKPFSCELCGARYKTRPGLTYHVNHAHKDGAGIVDRNLQQQQQPQPPTHMGPHHHHHHTVPPVSPHFVRSSPQIAVPLPSGAIGACDDVHEGNNERPSAPSFVGAPSLTSNSIAGIGGVGDSTALNPIGDYQPAAGRSSSRRPGGNVNYRESDGIKDEDAPLSVAAAAGPRRTVVDAKGRAVSLGYCDFCLGDAATNKKTGRPEELVACAECGRSGHPSCLQFTENMIISVKKYPWQCIECKCCTLCGTSENDDQLLFCDDCDRGYHMYCLRPPIKEPPEGSWSCDLCIETFHRK